MAKRVDLKAKQKRQKIIAAVGGVILLGILAIQGPKTWALLHAKAPEEPVPAATPAAPAPGSSVPLAPPTTAGAAPTASGSGSGLVDSDPVPLPTQNQLLSFNRFVTKDPFIAQISPESAPSAQPAASPAAPQPSPAASPFVPAPAGPSTAKGGTTAAPAPRGNQPAPTAATISVNGVAESVSTGKDFPASEPVFRLVSLTRKTAKISIAGGSFASGNPTITLELGKTLTLMNTADGTRYEIRLVSVH